MFKVVFNLNDIIFLAWCALFAIFVIMPIVWGNIKYNFKRKASRKEGSDE